MATIKRDKLNFDDCTLCSHFTYAKQSTLCVWVLNFDHDFFIHEPTQTKRDSQRGKVVVVQRNCVLIMIKMISDTCLTRPKVKFTPMSSFSIKSPTLAIKRLEHESYFTGNDFEYKNTKLENYLFRVERQSLLSWTTERERRIDQSVGVIRIFSI